MNNGDGGTKVKAFGSFINFLEAHPQVLRAFEEGNVGVVDREQGGFLNVQTKNVKDEKPKTMKHS